jgi:hypothetical protein
MSPALFTPIGNEADVQDYPTQYLRRGFMTNRYYWLVLCLLVAVTGMSSAVDYIHQDIDTASIDLSSPCASPEILAEDFTVSDPWTVGSISIWMAGTGSHPTFSLSIIDGGDTITGPSGGNVEWSSSSISGVWTSTPYVVPGTPSIPISRVDIQISSPGLYGTYWPTVQVSNSNYGWVATDQEVSWGSHPYVFEDGEWSEVYYNGQFVVISSLTTSLGRITWGDVKTLF